MDSAALVQPQTVSAHIVAAARHDQRRAITFVTTAGRDPRDALDAGADALLTDDPTVLDYVSAPPRGAERFRTLVLPWSTTYALLPAAPLPVTDTAAFRSDLARDVIGSDARGAARPAWWRDAQRCPVAENPVAPTAPTDRVVYALADRHARALAERLVGLAARLRAVGLGDAELSRAVAAGNEFGYVLALPSAARDACHTLAAFGLDARRVAALEPLVETRWRLVVRSGRFGVSIDKDGIPHFR